MDDGIVDTLVSFLPLTVRAAFHRGRQGIGLKCVALSGQSAFYFVRGLLAKRDLGCAEVGELPHCSESEQCRAPESVRRFSLGLLRHACSRDFQFRLRDSIDSATNSRFVHQTYLSDCVPTVLRR